MAKCVAPFRPLDVAVLTVSDSRSREEDSSGDYLAAALQAAGHRLAERALLPNDRYALRALVSRWIAEPGVQVVLVNGGTGFYEHNQTPEALGVLFDRQIEGFGELFRQLSFEELGSASLQSRALAGLANGTLIVALPGSTGACQLGWERLIREQLDASTRPCNFVPHLRVTE
ncbi:MAG: molybdenum cofactor biosynthesis protein B [Aeromonadaceae bacterium]|nr:molybdenum cofactor biosynthesis protein B [Aeromonadaceae bacterium]